METRPTTVFLVLTAAFLVLYGIFAWQPLFWCALVLAVVPLLSSTVAKWGAWAWMAFARAIGTFNSKVILTILFYLFLTPIALLFRLLTSPRHETPSTAFYERTSRTGHETFHKMW